MKRSPGGRRRKGNVVRMQIFINEKVAKDLYAMVDKLSERLGPVTVSGVAGRAIQLGLVELDNDLGLPEQREDFPRRRRR